MSFSVTVNLRERHKKYFFQVSGVQNQVLQLHREAQGVVLQQNALKLVEERRLEELDQAVKRPKCRSYPLSILRMRTAPSLCRMTKNDSCHWILTNCLVSFLFYFFNWGVI